jgi:hypothetical protein
MCYIFLRPSGGIAPDRDGMGIADDGVFPHDTADDTAVSWPMRLDLSGRDGFW